MQEKINKKNDKVPYIFLITLVAINLFLFSSVSPLHSLMNMQYNEWLYYLIGKGMVNGLVPYKDLIDHKGPYLFYFFGMANIINYKHIGLYILALLFYSLIAIFSYKISYLILSKSDKSLSNPINKILSIFTAFIIFVMCSSYYMSFGTISAEVFTLPYMFMSYYLFLKFLYYNGGFKNQPNSLSSELKYASVYGICAGISFFIKANAILAYVPIAICLLFYFIRKKQFKNLFLNFIVGLASFTIALLPAIIYSIMTNSLYEMIDGAFTINILYTGTGMPSSSSVYESLIETIKEFKEFTILCIFSIFTFNYFLTEIKKTGAEKSVKFRLKSQKLVERSNNSSLEIITFYILSLVINLYSVYMSCRPYTNYLVYLLVYFIPLFLFFSVSFTKYIFIGDNTTKPFVKQKNTLMLSIFLVSLLLINILSYSITYELSYTNGVVQGNLSSRVLKLYNNSDYKKTNPNILVVGYAPYLYEAFDTLPNEKYFATSVVSRKKYSKPYDAIIDRIKKADEDLVIVAFGRSMTKDKNFQDEVYAALNQSYINIGSTKTLGQTAEVYALSK